jgi:hypothetical protein
MMAVFMAVVVMRVPAALTSTASTKMMSVAVAMLLVILPALVHVHLVAV